MAITTSSAKAKGLPMDTRNRIAVVIRDYWGDESVYADQVHVTDHYTHSSLLDARGNPLPYEDRSPLGFDLRLRKGED